MLAQTFNRRMERGAGRVSIERIPYPVDQALKTLEGLKHIVLVGSRMPVAFFAYPDKPSLLAPEGHAVHHAARRIEEDSVHALEWLADELGADAAADRAVEVRARAARDRQDRLADARRNRSAR